MPIDTDDFAGAAGTDLAAHASAGGNRWRYAAPYGGTPAFVLDGAGGLSCAANAAAAVQWAELDVACPADTPVSVTVEVRTVSGAAGVLAPSGLRALIAWSPSGNSFGPGDLLRVTAAGDAATVAVNGGAPSALLSASASPFPVTGRPGVVLLGVAGGSTGLAVRDFVVGDPAPVAPPTVPPAPPVVAPASAAFDVVLCAGQSNMGGAGSDPQPVFAFSPPIPALITDASGVWQPLADPVRGASGRGSSLPAIANAYRLLTGRGVGFIPAAAFGSSVTQWQPGSDYLRAAVASVPAGVKPRAVLWWQGETDAVQGMDGPTYGRWIDQVSQAFFDAIGCPTLVCVVQGIGSPAPPALAGIQAAQRRCVLGNYPGRVADLSAMSTTPWDPIHVVTDAGLAYAGTVIGQALAAVFPPNGPGRAAAPATPTRPGGDP